MKLSRVVTWFAVATVGLGILLLLVGAVAWLNVDTQESKTVILARLSDTLRRPVRAQDVAIQLFPLKLSLSDLEVAEGETFDTLLFRADSIRVNIGLRSILSGTPVVDRLELLNPTLFLRRNAQGIWNIVDLFSASRDTSSEDGSGSPSKSPVRDWLLSGGTILIQGQGQQETRFENLEAKLNNIHLDRAFPAEIRFTLSDGGSLEWDGHLGPVNPDRLLSTPLSGRLRLESVGTAQLSSFLAWPERLVSYRTFSSSMDFDSSDQGTRMEGSVTMTGPDVTDPLQIELEGQVSADAGQFELTRGTVRLGAVPVDLSGKIGLEPSGRLGLTARIPRTNLQSVLAATRTLGVEVPQLAGADGEVEAGFEIGGSTGTPSCSGSAALYAVSMKSPTADHMLEASLIRLEFSPDRLDVGIPEVTAAGSSLNIELGIAGSESPRVEFRIQGDTLNLPEWQALLMPAGDAGSASGGTTADRTFPPWLSQMTAKGSLKVREIHKEALVVGPVSARLSLNKGILTNTAPIEFGLYDGTGKGSLRFDTTDAGLELAVQLELEGVDVDRFLSANTMQRDKLKGLLSGTVDVKGSTGHGDFLQSLSGTGAMALGNGRLTGVDLGRELGTLSEALGIRVRRGETPIEKMTAGLQIGRGWVRSDNIRVVTPDLTLTGKGGFSFEQDLALDALAAFKPTAVEETESEGGGPSGFLGALTGALLPRSDEGRILLPFNIKGTFSAPVYQLDAARLAQLQLGPGGGGLLEQFFPRRNDPPHR